MTCSSLGHVTRPALVVALTVAAVTTAGLSTTGPAQAAQSGATGRATAVRIVRTEVEDQERPLAVDTRRPRFQWTLASSRRGATQASVRVEVARSRAALGRPSRVLWDSGTKQTDRPWIEYGGPQLRPLASYAWRLTVTDDRGDSTSTVSSFGTAKLGQRWRGHWIGGPPAPSSCDDERLCSPAPLLRRVFTVKLGLTSARLVASGLGYGTFHLNGRRVGDDVLSPGFTDYSDRALYTVRDVTSYLRAGRNAIGAELGRGPFGSVGYNFAGYATAPWHADPQLRLELHLSYADGSRRTLVSDRSWRVTRGPHRFDDYMLGETYDARRADSLAGWSTPAYDDRGWLAASLTQGPSGHLEAQQEEPIRPQGQRRFRSVTRTSNGTWLFDLGKDVAGVAILDGDIPTGERITLHYGEKLDANGSVDTSGGSFDGKPMQLDTYIGGRGRDHWRPEFSYKGFQYVEVSGLDQRPSVDLLTAQVWRTDEARIGNWVSSNDLANRIFAAAVNSIESNTMSIPTDTPIYEKTGYTGDGQLVAAASSYVFDTRRFLAKWLVDIEESVSSNGNMGISAPLPREPAEPETPNGFAYASPGWDAALFVVPDVLERFAGDDRPGLHALDEMRRVMDYYAGRERNGVLAATCVVDLAQVCPDGLGDWTAPAGASYGAAVDSTAWYAYMLRELADTARHAGLDDVAEAARQHRRSVVDAFQETFTNPGDGTITDPFNPGPSDLTRPGTPRTYSQHQNAIALGLDMVPEADRAALGDALAADVRSRGFHLDTGIMGTRFLFGALTAAGHVDEAWKVLTQTTYPSYGYWLDALGYTGLGEYWESGQRSYNHQMYASVIQWLFEDLAGYRPTSPGFRTVLVRPRIPDGLRHVAAHTDTVRGRVAVSWTKAADGGLSVTVDLPVGTRARVVLPTDSPHQGVSESGTGVRYRLAQAPGVHVVARSEAALVADLVGGHYEFQLA